MTITQVFHTDGTQAVKLPDGFHPAAWPPGFFDSIRIDDPAFGRPEQGPVPPAPFLA
jgi:hypothetical protein